MSELQFGLCLLYKATLSKGDAIITYMHMYMHEMSINGPNLILEHTKHSSNKVGLKDHREQTICCSIFLICASTAWNIQNTLHIRGIDL